jgi:Sulfatase-modifying factor enzyme 1/L,D-transpeptidase catalytic domain/Caspase domain
MLTEPSDLDWQTVPLKSILTVLDKIDAQAKVVILDACRDNPFKQTESWHSSKGGSDVLASPGVLAALGEKEMPRGLLISYAAEAGHPAARHMKKDSRNSLYTEFLLNHITDQGQSLRAILEAVQDDVSKATSEHQIPYVDQHGGSSYILRHLVLLPGSESTQPAPANPPLMVTARPAPQPSASTKPEAPNLQGSASGERRVIAGIPFRWCSAGSFNNGKGTRIEIPRGFWIGETELTRSQWNLAKRNITSGNGKLPKTRVSWYQAKDWCNRMMQSASLPSGWRFDLPTEDQWEYACRAGSSTKYFFGDDTTDLSGFAWYGEPEATGHVHEVGQKKPNPWGLRDVYGNVWEWCSNRKASDQYALRGGGWADVATEIDYSDYSDAGTNSDSDSDGFRPAVVNDPQSADREAKDNAAQLNIDKKLPVVSSAAPKEAVSYWDGDNVKGSPFIKISLKEQRAYFYKGDKLVGVSDLSTGRPGEETPKGIFTIIEKKEIASDGKGGKMPFYMGISKGIGLHAGYLPGYPAARDRCIRMPEFMAENFFKSVSIGTPVAITD